MYIVVDLNVGDSNVNPLSVDTERQEMVLFVLLYSL